MLRIKRNRLFLLSVMLLAIPNAYALRLLNPFARVFEILFDFMRTDMIVYGFTFILFFAMQTAIYMAVMRNVAIFNEKKKVTKQGKIVAVTLALTANLAIFYFTKGKSIPDVLRDFLSPFGVFGALVLAIVMFLIIWQGFRKEGDEGWQLGLAVAGLLLMLLSSIMAYPNIMWLGFLLMAVGIFFLLLTLWKPKGKPDYGPGKDTGFEFPKEKEEKASSGATEEKPSPSEKAEEEKKTPEERKKEAKDLTKAIKKMLSEIDKNNEKRQEMIDKIADAENRLDPRYSAKWHMSPKKNG